MKKEAVDNVRSWIKTGQLDECEGWLKEELEKNPNDDELHFWMGNLKRHQNNWQEALQSYATATELNAESPAREARMMLMDIVRFYDKQRYNV